jgi:hypothetical protein
MKRRLSVLLFGAVALTFTACQSSTHSESALAEGAASPSPSPTPKEPESAWSASEPKINKMDGVVTQFVYTSGFAYLHMCFENRKPCSVPVAVVAPKNCYIESNVEGSSWKRRVRVKFDNEKPQTQLWSISDQRNAIFPSGPAAFIAKLKTHSEFDIEFGCDESDPGETVAMNIKGLQARLDSLKK